MAITLNTQPDKGLNVPVTAPVALTGYTLVVEYSHSSTFRSIVFTKSPQANGRQVSLTLTSAEVNSLKDSFFRVKGTKDGETSILIEGRLQYADAPEDDVLKTLQSVRTATGSALTVGNARTKFRDGFASSEVTQPDESVWTLINESPDNGTGAGHIINQGGDSSGSSYLRISLSPFVDNSSVWLTSKEKFRLPTKIGWGIATSQRIVGQEVLFGLAEASDTDSTGLLRNPPQTPADVPITGNGTTTSNVLTLPLAAGHPFRSGDRVIIVGCADTRLNVGPVIISQADATSISVPLTIANATYTTGASAVIRSADPLGRANNGFGMLLENATTTNASLVGRRNGTKPRIRNSTISATTSAQANTGNFADALVASSVQELFLSMDECSYRSFNIDSNSGMAGSDKFHQSIPDEELDYRLVVRARNLDDFSKPVARIVSAVKSGTTTATITTDRPHGLTTASRVGIYGIRDQGATAFPNTADIPVASVPDATTFTAVIGTAGTFTRTDGGVVFLNHGMTNSPGAMAYAIQSIARTSNVLTVTLSGTAAGLIPGDYVQLWGMNGAGAAAYEGAYRVLRQTGSTWELHAPGPDFASITTGGAVIKRTDVRLHFVRVLDHTRHLVEVLGGRGNTVDSNNAVPVTITSSTTVPTSTTPRTKAVESLPATTTALSASGTYTGTAIDGGTDVTLHHARHRVVVMHNAGAVHGHLVVEFSTDNSTWRESHRVPVPSDAAYHTFEFPVVARYTRYRFINGTTAQTAFYFGVSGFRGEAAAETAKNLAIPLTAAAGQAATASATTTFSSVDLGNNHLWNTVRLFVSSDVTGTVFIDESMDNSNWATVGAGWGWSGVAAVRAEQQITNRYLRVRHVNGAGAATTVRAVLSLISL